LGFSWNLRCRLRPETISPLRPKTISHTFHPVFLRGCRGGALGGQYHFHSVTDTFNSFSQKRTFPSKYAWLFEYDINFWQTY